ncbi:MAG: hypothetical protein L0170_12085 [Acidobacteria bacterium]|nr:hypothetical protein [Acidobacteriota bacterium]
MATKKARGKESAADPKAVREGIGILKEFQPMLELILREDLSEEERGRLILKRFPPEILIPLKDRIDAVRATLPTKAPHAGEPGK